VINYGFTKTIDLPLEQAEKKVREQLDREGFGVLERIDLQEKLKAKLGVNDVPRYIILGACNPPNAYKALKAEENIGLMLPCNVVLYEKAGRTVVGAIKPSVAMGMIQNNTLAGVAADVEARLQRVIAAM
jgi:uncharacterized protein (DUF302 family)